MFCIKRSVEFIRCSQLGGEKEMYRWLYSSPYRRGAPEGNWTTVVLAMDRKYNWEVDRVPRGKTTEGSKAFEGRLQDISNAGYQWLLCESIIKL
jgi:hypothetical protein